MIVGPKKVKEEFDLRERVVLGEPKIVMILSRMRGDCNLFFLFPTTAFQEQNKGKKNSEGLSRGYLSEKSRLIVRRLDPREALADDQ